MVRVRVRVRVTVTGLGLGSGLGSGLGLGLEGWVIVSAAQRDSEAVTCHAHEYIHAKMTCVWGTRVSPVMCSGVKCRRDVAALSGGVEVCGAVRR